eukprot:GEZU01004944.1.p2 GENE.GEZU01004944.1~~GEZU01004944.1.p2  ORF type:complete len:140 (-),score=9.33 GEZU01004944.1:255-674(-)
MVYYSFFYLRQIQQLQPPWRLVWRWCVHQIGIEEFDKLLILQAYLVTGIPSVLGQNRSQIPPLKLSQAPYQCSCSMPAEVAHYGEWVIVSVENDVQRGNDDLLGYRPPRSVNRGSFCAQISSLRCTEMYEIDPLILHKI